MDENSYFKKINAERVELGFGAEQQRLLALVPGVKSTFLQVFLSFPPDIQKSIFNFIEEKKKQGISEQELQKKANDLIEQSFHYLHVTSQGSDLNKLPKLEKEDMKLEEELFDVENSLPEPNDKFVNDELYDVTLRSNDLNDKYINMMEKRPKKTPNPNKTIH